MELPEEVMQAFSEAEEFFTLGDIDSAIARIDKALPGLEGDILESDALNNKGFYLLHLAQWEEAIACFEKAYLIDPGFSAVLNHLAWAALMIDNKEGALALMELFDKQKADYQALHLRNLAFVYTIEGQSKMAIKQLLAAQEEDPYMAYVDVLLQANGYDCEQLPYPPGDLQCLHLKKLLA